MFVLDVPAPFVFPLFLTVFVEVALPVIGYYFFFFAAALSSSAEPPSESASLSSSDSLSDAFGSIISSSSKTALTLT